MGLDALTVPVGLDPLFLVELFELFGDVLRHDGNVLVAHLHPEVVVFVEQDLDDEVRVRIVVSQRELGRNCRQPMRVKSNLSAANERWDGIVSNQ